MPRKLNKSNWSKVFKIKTYGDLRQYPLDLIIKAIQRLLYQEEYQRSYRDMSKKAREQYRKDEPEETDTIPFPVTSFNPLKEKVISTLTNLGYQKDVAEKAIEQSLANGEKQSSVQEAVKGALDILIK